MVWIFLPENLQPRREDFAMSETRLNEKARDAMPTPSSSEVNSTVPSWLAPFETRQDLEPLSRSGWMGVITGFFSVLALPIIYGGLVGLLFLGLWVHATNLHGLLEPHNETTLAYYAPIFGGVLVLVFMIVPFLFTRKQPESSYELSDTEHGTLFQFVHAIADHVGADRPTAIKVDLDTQVRVFKGDDDKTVVTFGLPLIATCTLRQLAGLLGQQLHQCSKRPEVAYWSFVQMIHDLFARSAYKKGAGEFVVPHWGGIERQKSSVSIGFIPWGFAKLAELFGAAIKTNIERDADYRQAKISGSEEFAATHLDVHLLQKVVALSRQGLEAAKCAGREIPDLPKFYAGRIRTLKAKQPQKINEICQDLMMPTAESTAGQSVAQRVARVQQLNTPGIFHIDAPAEKVFAGFGALCREVSKDHYETHFADRIASHDAGEKSAEEDVVTPSSLAPSIPLPPADSDEQINAKSPGSPAATSAPIPQTEAMEPPVGTANVTPPAPQPRQSLDNHDTSDFDSSDVLDRFLQGDVLTSHQEFFLPLQDLLPAKEPKRMLELLDQARNRYLTLVREQQSDLHELSRAIMRQRALQMAETMSAAGLEIGSDALGLSSSANRVVREACQAHGEKLNDCRKSVQELREQAVLRFVAALQLAGVPEIAQQFVRSSDEIESARIAVKCLSDLKSIWPKVRELAGRHRQLRCLWFNLAGNEHVEDLTNCINLSSCETMELLRDINAELPRFTCAAELFGLGNIDCDDLPDGIDGQTLVTHSAELVGQLESLYRRCFIVIAQLAEQAEGSLGHAPLPVPAKAGVSTVEA